MNYLAKTERFVLASVQMRWKWKCQGACARKRKGNVPAGNEAGWEIYM